MDDELFLRNGWPTEGVNSYFQPGQLSKILTIENFGQAASKIWRTCAEYELRLCSVKLCSNGAHISFSLPSLILTLPTRMLKSFLMFRNILLLATFVGNKAKGQISKRVFQENKARQIFRTFLVFTCAYQGLRSIRFSENLACFVFLNNPFWDSSFCLITDALWYKSHMWNTTFFMRNVKLHQVPVQGQSEHEEMFLFL